MRQVNVSVITQTLRELFQTANYVIGDDIKDALKEALKNEESPIGRSTLDMILENYEIAASEKIACCQDTGMAVIFAEIGQEVALVGGSFEEAVDEGVRLAYAEGYLRKSVVSDPIFTRQNTKDNTPAILHTRIVGGDKISLTVCPKGFGSENMGGVKMLTPADGREGIIKFVVETVKNAGPNPCPPTVVGVGVGGTLEKAAILAKHATCRPINQRNENPDYAELEREILRRINNLGIGPGGTGGRCTSLAVNIDYYPTHIAGLPVAVNLCCHAARHAHAEI